MSQFVALTDVGHRKSTNEDAVLTQSLDDCHLLVVADGMGGHAAGDVASESAVNTILDVVLDQIDNEIAYEQLLVGAVESANKRIQQKAEENPEQTDMGTTVVAAIVEDNKASIVNVGDSRAYDIGDSFEQITVDQSLVQELVEAGELTEEEAKDHPQSNILSQADGTTDELDPDTYTRELDGTLLLCSDGLTDKVPEERIQDIVTQSADLDQRAMKLIEVANEIDGSDNVSVVLYE